MRPEDIEKVLAKYRNKSGDYILDTPESIQLGMDFLIQEGFKFDLSQKDGRNYILATNGTRTTPISPNVIEEFKKYPEKYRQLIVPHYAQDPSGRPYENSEGNPIIFENEKDAKEYARRRRLDNTNENVGKVSEYELKLKKENPFYYHNFYNIGRNMLADMKTFNAVTGGAFNLLLPSWYVGQVANMAKGEGSAKGWLENAGWGEIPGINPTLATVLNGTTDVVVLAPRASWQLAKATGNVALNFAKTLSRQAKNAQRIASNPELAERMAEHYWKVVLDVSKNAGNAAKNTAKALGKGETYTNFARSAWQGTKLVAKTAWQETKDFAKAMKTGEYPELPKKLYIKPEIRHYENGVLILPKPTVVYEQGVPIIPIKNSPLDNWASLEKDLSVSEVPELVKLWTPESKNILRFKTALNKEGDFFYPDIPEYPDKRKLPYFEITDPDTGKKYYVYKLIPEKEGTSYLIPLQHEMKQYLKSDKVYNQFLNTIDPGTGRFFTEADYLTFLKELELIMNNTFYVPSYDYGMFLKNRDHILPETFEEMYGPVTRNREGVTMLYSDPKIPLAISIRYPTSSDQLIQTLLHELSHASFGGVYNGISDWVYKYPLTSRLYQANINTLEFNPEYWKLFKHPKIFTDRGLYISSYPEVIAEARAYNMAESLGLNSITNNKKLFMPSDKLGANMKKLAEGIISLLSAAYLGIKTNENEKENLKDLNTL